MAGNCQGMSCLSTLRRTVGIGRVHRGRDDWLCAGSRFPAVSMARYVTVCTPRAASPVLNSSGTGDERLVDRSHLDLEVIGRVTRH
jgi:hypothetical protein